MSSAPADISAFLGDGLVQSGHSGTRTLQLSAQPLKRGTILFLQRDKPRQSVGDKRRAGIDRCPLDQPLQRVANLLGPVDGGGD